MTRHQSCDNSADHDEGRHVGTDPVVVIGIPDAGPGALGSMDVGENRSERRLVRYQGSHVMRVGRHEGERGHRSAAACEHLDRARAERPDDRVDVGGLGPERVVDPAVLAGAAAEAARVIGDQRALGEVAARVPTPPASMGWPIINNGGRATVVGSGPWTS